MIDEREDSLHPVLKLMEALDNKNQREIKLDLDVLLTRASKIYTPEEFKDWLDHIWDEHLELMYLKLMKK